MYSNSTFDRNKDSAAASDDQTAVRSMYEDAPYPGLGAGLKDMSLFLAPIEGELARRPKVRFLDAGCGTGHYLVGVAKRHPEWECCGLDLSQASLDVAQELAALHGTTVTARQLFGPVAVRPEIRCHLGVGHRPPLCRPGRGDAQSARGTGR